MPLVVFEPRSPTRGNCWRCLVLALVLVANIIFIYMFIRYYQQHGPHPTSRWWWWWWCWWLWWCSSSSQQQQHHHHRAHRYGPIVIVINIHRNSQKNNVGNLYNVVNGDEWWARTRNMQILAHLCLWARASSCVCVFFLTSKLACAPGCWWWWANKCLCILIPPKVSYPLINLRVPRLMSARVAQSDLLDQQCVCLYMSREYQLIVIVRVCVCVCAPLPPSRGGHREGEELVEGGNAQEERVVVDKLAFDVYKQQTSFRRQGQL